MHLRRCAPALRGGVIKTSPAADDAIKFQTLIASSDRGRCRVTAVSSLDRLTLQEDSGGCSSWIFPPLSFHEAT